MPSSAWEKRNARARAAGYQSYYDYRAHDYGRLPPEAPRARGAALRRLRGHASVADLRRAVDDGSFVRAVPDESSRSDQTGQLRRVYVTLVDSEGVESEYQLIGRQFSDENMKRLRLDLEGEGVSVDTQYWEGVAA